MATERSARRSLKRVCACSIGALFGAMIVVDSGFNGLVEVGGTRVGITTPYVPVGAHSWRVLSGSSGAPRWEESTLTVTLQ